MTGVLTGALVALSYVVGIFTAVHAATSTRTAQGAVAWVVSLIAFPFLAVPAYLFLGRNKFAGRTQAFRDSHGGFEDVIERYREGLAPHVLNNGEQPDWHHALEQLTGFELAEGHEVELLINGETTFDSIEQGISQARNYILFQFYLINNDELGRRMRDALAERAKAGVRVFVLYDEIGSLGIEQAFIDSFTSAGIQVSPFKPTRGRGNRFQINFRNHRKMVVVDGVYAWVGGHNVGDAYLGRNPKFSPWRDTHLRMKGPAVMQVQLIILGDWYWATRNIPEVMWQPAVVEDGKQAIMLATGPASRLENASLFFVWALSHAKKRAWLSAAYFVPDDAVMKALQLAALRGVDVRIITTAKGDSLPTHLAGFHYIDELRDLGIRFYAWSPGFMHQKVMLIDDEISSVGTHNIDNRSFRLNFEISAVILDKAFNQEMACMLENDFEQAQVLDPAGFDYQTLWWRLGVKFSRLLAPLL